MSHTTFAAAVAAGSRSQPTDASSYPLNMDINLSTNDNAPMDLKECDVPKYLEKRARLEDISNQSSSFENENENPPKYEYIPDSCGIEKKCLSPCGKASLTSAVVGSPVAGKSSIAKKDLFSLSTCIQFSPANSSDKNYAEATILSDKPLYQQDNTFDDVFRVPARPIGNTRAITKSPMKTKFNHIMDSPLKGTLIGSMPPPFSSFENPMPNESPTGFRSITKKNDATIIQQDLSLPENGEHGFDYPFTRSLSSDTDSDAGYGTSCNSNDISNTSSLSVTRSNSTNLPEIQCSNTDTSAERKMNTSRTNYVAEQNLDMDGLSDLLRALSHQQGMRPLNTTNKEFGANPNSLTPVSIPSSSKPVSTMSESLVSNESNVLSDSQFAQFKYAQNPFSAGNEGLLNEMGQCIDNGEQREGNLPQEINEKINKKFSREIGINEPLEITEKQNKIHSDIDIKMNDNTAMEIGIEHRSTIMNEFGTKMQNAVEQKFCFNSLGSKLAYNEDMSSQECVGNGAFPTLSDDLMLQYPNLHEVNFQVPPPTISNSFDLNMYDSARNQFLQEKREKLQYILNENANIQRQSIINANSGISAPSYRSKYPNPFETQINHTHSFLQPPPQMRVPNYFDRCNSTHLNNMNNVFPGFTWPHLRGDGVSLERAARIHRSSAAINEASCHWSGQLPHRIQRNCSFSCKVFLGGVPWDISEAGLIAAFKPFGNIRIEWPGRDNVAIPKGYLYVLFEHEKQVRSLLSSCTHDYGFGGSWYYKVSSRRMRNKEVQVIPWIISDSSYVRCSSQRLDPQKTVFVGALHGMLNAEGLSIIFNDLFGGVIYAGIDTDKYKYPIGSARVTFNNHKSYMRAVAAAFIEIKTTKFIKKVQVDPYLEDALCSSCQIRQGPYFCRDLRCFKYFCRCCWEAQHEALNVYHKPLMRNCKTNGTSGGSISSNTCLTSRSFTILGSSHN